MKPTRSASSASRTQHVLISTGGFLPGFKGGGPIKSVVEIVERLPATVHCLVITADRDFGDAQPYPGLSGTVVDYLGHDVFYFNWRKPTHWLRLNRLARRSRLDLLYLNSFWSPLFTIAPVIAHQLRLLRAGGVLLAPRGELSPGALTLKSRKKRLVLSVWAPLLKSVRPLFHASTHMEAAEIRTTLPWAETVVQVNTRGREPRPEIVPTRERARFAFVSRIAPKKNLALALRALRQVTEPLDFDIFGPTEDQDYWRQCQDLMSAIPSRARVTYRGTLAPDQTPERLADYDAFIFPTLGENFGHVIIESLSAGCPVLCSDQTPWNDVFRAGGGSVIPQLDDMVWAREIDRVARLPRAERDTMKRATLRAYAAWRGQATDRLAIEVALERQGTSGVP